MSDPVSEEIKRHKARLVELERQKKFEPKYLPYFDIDIKELKELIDEKNRDVKQLEIIHFERTHHNPKCHKHGHGFICEHCD
jgi:hypothetical protein